MRRARRLPGRLERACALTAALSAAAMASGRPGATLPWQTYEAESMETTGVVSVAGGLPGGVATESSGLRCVNLLAPGQYVAFTAAHAANALVIRYSLPDAPHGGGLDGALEIRVNGVLRRTVPVTSRYSWLYGKYPFSNDPAQHPARNFYDEAQIEDLPLAAGDRIQIGDAPGRCTLDLVDTEMVPTALAAPAKAIVLTALGARGDGRTDCTDALRRAIAAAASAGGGTVWIQPGEFLITGDIVLASNVRLQGAGMWHTRFVGSPALYRDADRRVRFILKGEHIVLSDFALFGRLDYRNDQEPNDGVLGAGCRDCTIRRLWIEHTKTGIWVYNGVGLHIEGCRLRDTIADGVNLCVGCYGCVVEQCAARGTGDDCFAIWPAASDQGHDTGSLKPGHNVIRHCTGQLPFLANGGALYGGDSNTIEDCEFTDITTGCGILVSTTFPTGDPAHGIDNNFRGTTRVSRCELVRCGGWDHEWGYRGALQLCLDRRGIAGLHLDRITIVDSLSDGITVVAPGMAAGHGTLSNSRLQDSSVSWSSPGAHRGLWIRNDAVGALQCVSDSLGLVRNESARFQLEK